MTKKHAIKLAFYGDDFTGSTDALDFLTRAGARTILFLNKPTPQQIARFDYPEAIGIAGMTRAMPPKEMANTLGEAFQALKSLSPRHVHYKVCSTFDSSPEIGNIGTAIETGLAIFQNAYTPVLPAAPHLGRYAAFGNLFARMGTVNGSEIHRLDRHPSMSRHPVTPSTESDLRVHLATQTPLQSGLVDLLDIEQSIPLVINKLTAEVANGSKIIFFDTMYENQLSKIGAVLDEEAKAQAPFFSVGSSGIEKALGDYWESRGVLQKRAQWTSLSVCQPMLVLSGSVSPVTAAQIEWATANGFAEVAVEAEALVAENADQFIATYQQRVLAFFRAGKSVIVHTAKGPNDPRAQQIKSALKEKGWDGSTRSMHTARRLGDILGKTAINTLNQFPVKRLVIAGGDTSSHVARILGIEAVEMIAPAYPGAPICRAYATQSAVDGIEINLKGGQVGDETYFGALQQGIININ